MKFLTVIGARPQFIKAAPLSRALRKKHREILVHTGQHYDYAMSQQFFRELRIPRPDFNLEVGSGLHGAQTAAMLAKLEPVVIGQRPDAVIIFGDTNSTLAGALIAAKLHIPLAHIEAGMRSFNRMMPEEVNRVVADHLSDIHFCSTDTAVRNLRKEGITGGLYMVGDIMYDALRDILPTKGRTARMIKKLDLISKGYLFVTIHRAENTDDPDNLSAIMEALISSGKRAVFPVHPRTEKKLKEFSLWDKLKGSDNILLIPPQGYRESLALQSAAHAVITDSGGIQKEAYLLKTPCLTVRRETEWVETVKTGWNHLVGPDKKRILNALAGLKPPVAHPDLYGHGDTARLIVKHLERHLGR
jgi:UDP-N-acetylglucosamine 2-epimerase (non-hydrolysing)